LHEIWIATRFGGYHFAFKDNRWFDERNQQEFMPFVIDAIHKQSGIALKLTA
jgi:CyaY protein